MILIIQMKSVACFLRAVNNSVSRFIDKWIKVALVNFLVVAVVGVILRYKISFTLPAVNQKNLLHGHSHFAFAGWLSQILMTLIAKYIAENKSGFNIRHYRALLWANTITAYGMLFTFPFQGYGLYSIIFSTLSVFVSYVFIFIAWRDLNKLRNKQHINSWFKAGLVFNGLSSLGPFFLAYLMANHINSAAYYFGAVYFFLHFQYNGWFLFACFGLFFSWLEVHGFGKTAAFSKKIFFILVTSCAPAYLLSVLWMEISPVARIVAAITAALQFVSVVYVLQLFRQSKKIFNTHMSRAGRLFWFMAMCAFIIKVVLQFLSVIPSLSAYAFGFRPVVIGYLHLCFLGMLSFFALGYVYFQCNTRGKFDGGTGVYIFMAGVIVTESVLMLQGLLAMNSKPLPHADLVLFIAAVALLTGISAISIHFYRMVPGNTITERHPPGLDGA